MSKPQNKMADLLYRKLSTTWVFFSPYLIAPLFVIGPY